MSAYLAAQLPKSRVTLSANCKRIVHSIGCIILPHSHGVCPEAPQTDLKPRWSTERQLIDGFCNKFVRTHAGHKPTWCPRRASLVRGDHLCSEHHPSANRNLLITVNEWKLLGTRSDILITGRATRRRHNSTFAAGCNPQRDPNVWRLSVCVHSVWTPHRG